jgi:nucleotide-binding universal stress UspA family protein
MLPIRTILHPTDFSGPSEWAFRLACSLARDHGARLLALHVAPPPVHGLARAHVEEYDGLWQDLLRFQAPDLADQLAHQLRHGHPLTEILRVARVTPCDLIVMGTHCRSGVGRLLMGSVAEAVVRRAPCPTITVKTPFPEPALAPAAQADDCRAFRDPCP